MLILYNLLQTLLILVFLPGICIYIAAKDKYRHHIPKRLGIGLKKALKFPGVGTNTIWLHALSVGEVTSALPLLEQIRKQHPDTRLVFSSSTSSGYKLACSLASPHCHAVIAFPLDVLPVVSFFIKVIQPNLFILVETDFWPNILHCLKRKNIPLVLVNGRVSQKAANQYRQFSLFFLPMFQCLDIFCVQSQIDRDRLLRLGVEPHKIRKLGNLKYEPSPPVDIERAKNLISHIEAPVFTAGSTHPGEEEILLRSFIELRRKFDCRLIIAPRDIKRGGELSSLISSFQLHSQTRSAGGHFTADVFILDTIGELTAFYHFSDICYVGGSLVNEGGHNPLEPASLGKPVLFGPHMTDFAEITEELVRRGGGFFVAGVDDLTAQLVNLLGNDDLRKQSGERARQCITEKQGLLQAHLQVIQELL